MRINFSAHEGGFEDDGYALLCGVSGEEHYLTFDRDADDSEDDWGVHFEYDDQSMGDYDCVKQCRLSRTLLAVDLSRQLHDLVGVEGFDVALSLDDESYRALREGLPKVFRGKEHLLAIEG